MIKASSLTQIITIMAVTLSCGEESTRKPDDTDRIIPPTYTQDPPQRSYFIADKTCQAKDSAFSVRSVFPMLASSTGLTLVETPVLMESNESLSSSAIKSTHYNRMYSRGCKYDPSTIGRFQCNDSQGNLANWSYFPHQDQPLKICNSGKQYERDAVESIALTAAVYLDNAKNFYQSVFPANDLPKVILEVLPHYVTTYEDAPHPTIPNKMSRQKLFITNNLAYASNSRSITVFPESKGHRSRHPDAARLWESPFVLAHEYGHHIEQILYGKLLSANRLAWDGPMHRHQILGTNKASIENQKARTMTALSEAFADLFGFFAANDLGESIYQLPTLGKDRHPKEGHLTSAGVDKKINELTLSAFMKPTSLGSLTPHQFGAITAHVLESMISQTSESCLVDKTVALQKKLSLRILMRFQMEILSKLAMRELNDEAFLSSLIESLEAAIVANLNSCSLSSAAPDSIKAKVCKTSEPLLPKSTDSVFHSYCDLPAASNTL